MFKRENWIKKQLLNSHTVKAMWSQSGSATIAELAVYAGWPVILIDNEHGYTGLETTVHLIRAVESAGGHTILRAPWNDQVYLKRILDIGVQSLMIPMINNRRAAEEAVAACKYPPQGRRGYAAPMVRASGYGTDSAYGKNANDQLLLIAQIEHVESCDNIAEIAAVDGIDMLFIGPYDLAGSMGYFENIENSKVMAVIDEIEKRIHISGKMLGGFPLPGRTNKELEDNGYRLIAGQSDILLFRNAAATAARKL